MNRRAVLAGAGIAAASLAGCAGDTIRAGRNGPDDGTPGNSPEETGPQRLATGEAARFHDGTWLSVVDPRVRVSIVADYSQFLAVEREGGLQFVVVDVVGDADSEPTSFVVVRDGDVEAPPRAQRHVRSVTRGCEGACIAVPVVAEAVASAAIAYRSDDELRAVWELDDATVAAFSKVPDLRLRDATVTDEAGDVGIECTVENVGERDGVFSAIVAPAWVADVEEPVGFPVPRDETVTETIVPDEIRRLEPDGVAFTEEPTGDTRRFELESDS